MATIKEKKEPVEVKDKKTEWGMFALNFLMTCLVVVGGFALEQLTSINNKVGSIDTTTQLNAQHIETLFDANKRHEMADNEKFTDIINQIRKLQEKQ